MIIILFYFILENTEESNLLGEGNISQTVKTDLVKGKERKDATVKPSPKERRRSPIRTDAREHLKSKHEKVESMYLHMFTCN